MKSVSEWHESVGVHTNDWTNSKGTVLPSIVTSDVWPMSCLESKPSSGTLPFRYAACVVFVHFEIGCNLWWGCVSRWMVAFKFELCGKMQWHRFVWWSSCEVQHYDENALRHSLPCNFWRPTQDIPWSKWVFPEFLSPNRAHFTLLILWISMMLLLLLIYWLGFLLVCWIVGLDRCCWMLDDSVPNTWMIYNFATLLPDLLDTWNELLFSVFHVCPGFASKRRHPEAGIAVGVKTEISVITSCCNDFPSLPPVRSTSNSAVFGVKIFNLIHQPREEQRWRLSCHESQDIHEGWMSLTRALWQIFHDTQSLFSFWLRRNTGKVRRVQMAEKRVRGEYGTFPLLLVWAETVLWRRKNERSTGEKLGRSRTHRKKTTINGPGVQNNNHHSDNNNNRRRRHWRTHKSSQFIITSSTDRTTTNFMHRRRPSTRDTNQSKRSSSDNDGNKNYVNERWKQQLMWSSLWWRCDTSGRKCNLSDGETRRLGRSSSLAIGVVPGEVQGRVLWECIGQREHLDRFGPTETDTKGMGGQWIKVCFTIKNACDRVRGAANTKIRKNLADTPNRFTVLLSSKTDKKLTQKLLYFSVVFAAVCFIDQPPNSSLEFARVASTNTNHHRHHCYSHHHPPSSPPSSTSSPPLSQHPSHLFQ